MRRAELNEIIVVAADRTRGLANGLNLHSRHGRQGTWKKLVLHFPSDGNFIRQAPALGFFFDELGDGAGHFVERFSKLTQLVAALDLHAMREVHGLHILRAAVEIGNCPGNTAREYNSCGERCRFDEQEDNYQENEKNYVGMAQFSERREDPPVQSRWTSIGGGKDRAR